MKPLFIRLCLIITVFISVPLWANESSDFDARLVEADNLRSSQPKRFIVLIGELNKQANQLTEKQKYYLDYLNLYLSIYQGHLAEAINSASELVNSDADTLLKFRTKLSLVNIFANSQNWIDGLSTLASMLDEIPLITDEKLQHLAFNIASIFYNQMGQPQLALSYAKQVELVSSEGRSQCLAKMLIIESLYKLKQLTPSDPMINHAISLCRINKELLNISFIKHYVAKMHLENNEHEKALTLLKTSLQDALNTKYSRVIAGYYSLLAQAHWLNNDLPLTKQFALKALDNEKKEGTTEAKVLSYKLLFEVEKAQSNYEMALLYHEKYAVFDKQYYDENQAKYLAFQLAEHQALEQKNKIDLLNESNALLTAEKSLLTAEQALIKANAQNNRYIMMVLIITLSVLTLWGLRLYKAHKRIKQLAEYDALTGIFNRGHFTQTANHAIKYCASAQQELSIIVFDLDYFKSINDQFGHACGDWALKKVVKVCQTIGRQNDIFARLGGEEFCILLTSCDKHAALVRAAACRLAIEEIDTSDSGFDFNITASFGITDAKTSGFNLEKLVADADTAAYAAKDSGRNNVVIFEPDNEEKYPKNVIKLDDSRDAF